MSLFSRWSTNPRFSANPRYRADIDGLRAIAVISVILFHLQSGSLSGGYVGVDIFFVISGFLITQMIVRGHEEKNFSLAHFYERRARRLGPSLVVLLLLTTLFATLMLSPADLVLYSGALISSVLFVANILFYTQSNYFNSDLDNKPLLHVWSLSVEEQFYLFLPLLLLLLLRYGLRGRVWIPLLMLGIASLIGSVYLTRTDAQAAFYLLPARVFEFLIGAALVWLPRLPSSRRIVCDVLVAIGIAMIGTSIVSFTQSTPFPSYHALLPCIGAALVIYAGRDARVLGRIVGQPLTAYIGRISYELYLFHWPVIVFYKYLAFEVIDRTDIAIMLSMTVVLSMLTYHLIACPLRYGFARNDRQRHDFLIGLGTACVALMLVAFSMKMQDGWIWRIPEKSLLFTRNPGKFHETQFGGIGYKDNTLLILGDESAPPQFLLFGDSFAAQYGLALSDFLKAHHRSAYAFFHTGCLMMPHISSNVPTDMTKGCPEGFSKVAAALQNNNLPVVQAQSWSSYKDNLQQLDGTKIAFPVAPNDEYYQFIISGIDRVRQTFLNHRYVVVGISPGIKEQKSLARCFQIPNYLPNRCASSVAFKEETQLNGQEFNLAMAKYAAAHPEVTFMNPRDALCKNGMCHAIDASRIYYSDYSHFSKDGAEQVINHFSDLLLSLHP